MVMDTLISVIIPVYNVEEYLRECLESVLCQTYKNMEVILVDDGSQDVSGEICDEYADRYPNFTVYHKANAGLGMARNTGLEHMTGEYVTFLDSDDYLEPDCIEMLYEELIKAGVDMCKGGFRRVTDIGKTVSVREYKDELYKGDRAKKELLPRMIGSSPSQHDSVEMCVCGTIYRTEPIRKYQLRFPSEREMISEDLVFNMDYMQHANGACTMAYAGYFYRINMSSLTTGYREDRFSACKFFYLEIRKKLELLGYDELVVLRAQRMFFIYIRMSIAQEGRGTGLSSGIKHIKKIRKICYDETVREIIRAYPIRKLGIKQFVFLKMIAHKMAVTLYMIAMTGKL